MMVVQGRSGQPLSPFFLGLSRCCETIVLHFLMTISVAFHTIILSTALCLVQTSFQSDMVLLSYKCFLYFPFFVWYHSVVLNCSISKLLVCVLFCWSFAFHSRFHISALAYLAVAVTPLREAGFCWVRMRRLHLHCKIWRLFVVVAVQFLII